MSGMAFFRKEVTEIVRRKKALIIAVVFAAFALLGIGTALLTPKILLSVEGRSAALRLDGRIRVVFPFKLRIHLILLVGQSAAYHPGGAS